MFSFKQVLIDSKMNYISEPNEMNINKRVYNSSLEGRCPNCGRIIPEDSRICPYCSKRF